MIYFSQLYKLIIFKFPIFYVDFFLSPSVMKVELHDWLSFPFFYLFFYLIDILPWFVLFYLKTVIVVIISMDFKL